MEDISKKLFEALKVSCDSCTSNSLSLSGGLDSTILAYYLKRKKPKAVAVIAKNFVSNDLTFCQLAAKEFDLPLTIIDASISDILEALVDTITILKNFNEIEIRNNVVMYLTLKWAKDNGLKGIITGDGADELFAGYSFLRKKSEDEIEKEVQRIYSIMHFPTQKIGKALGVMVESPFLDEKIIELAQSIPMNLMIKTENDKKHGKWILRKTFEKYIPVQIAWREKSPMQDGSGTNGLTSFFNSTISDEIFLEKKSRIQQELGIAIRSKESLHYFEIYHSLYNLPQGTSDSSKSCPFCRCDTENLRFCRMCGAFPI